MELNTVNKIPVGKTPEDRFIAQKDELSYNSILNNLAQSCLLTRGTMDFSRYVKSFEHALNIDIDGLPFRKRITEINTQLTIDLAEYKKAEKKRLGNKYFKHAEQAKLNIRAHVFYYENKFNSLLQLLAEHNALIAARAHISEGDEPGSDEHG